ncbi:MAG: DNA mismatch repair protein MutS [Erysipelotrichales bacterium]|nr:DNA mismatch repair protein MutS [Erysipelotrichales bacterium]
MAQYTPMMRQYLEVKKNLQDTIVFYRLGDFYEMFFDDAKKASMELDLVLTGRDAGVEERVPMCGIPYHAHAGYVQRLVNKGYKVAIVEQLEDPSQAKGIVKRDVVKVYTPGTYVDENDDKNCIYIGSVSYDSVCFVVTLVDNASGETLYTILDKNIMDLEQFLYSMNVKEIVVSPDFETKYLNRLKENSLISVSFYEDDSELFEYAYLLYGIYEPALLSSFYRLLHYMNGKCKQALSHLRPIRKIERENELKMDYYTKRNLELTSTIRLQSRNGTLWHFLDHCRSAMGSRMLRRWIEHPLNDEKKIEMRANGIEYLMDHILKRDTIEENMKHVYDIERIIAKLAYKSVNARDFVRLGHTLAHVPEILEAMRGCESYASFVDVDTCSELGVFLRNAFLEEVPISVKEGGMFKDGFYPALDEIRDLRRSGKNYIAALEAKERERTGIKSLKIGYNRVFGYYIEVSSANLSLVKEEYGYVRKQTLTNAERFITAELKEKEDAILHAQEKEVQLEYALFQDVIEKASEYLHKLQRLADVLSVLDVLASLSSVSLDYGYVRPTFNHSHTLNIRNGRHPIMEQFRKDTMFVANDCILQEEEHVLLITGPNMGGKSTYMRQVGLIVIMAQMGCFVPADSCDLPLFDQIFTRIGANDDLMSGQSTFMVEMMEANHALTNATANSLILFDEIGRGTSTYDGMALAQSMLEYICTVIKAKTLFSTHYHELTSLDATYPSLKNVHVMVEEQDQEVTFLYKVADGRSDRSYGINVARLAKLPEDLLSRAQDILGELEESRKNETVKEVKPKFVKEDRSTKRVMELLDTIKPYEITPIEATQILVRLKALAQGE